jgi:hypothetical protein
MNSKEYLRTLMLLSQMEGYMLGKLGTHIPEPIANELLEVCELLAKNIRGEENE